MRIAYCTNVRLPNERAHGHQIAAVTKALVDGRHDVTIFAPFRKNHIRQDFSSYYRASTNIRLVHLGSFDPIASPIFPGVLGLWILNWMLRRNLTNVLHDYDLLYTRSPSLLDAMIASRIPTVLELHRLPTRGKSHFVSLCNRCRLIVCLTRPMANELSAWGVTARTIVESDAVDLSRFDDASAPPHRVEKPLIVYAGQLESMGLSKGIPELLAALKILSERGIPYHAIIAGGPERSKARFTASIPPPLRSHITFTGHLPASEIPTLLHSASVLVYPAPQSSHPFYRRDTSPLKLFEYAAARRPIVSADLPPIRDVFTDAMVTFVPSGDAAALAEALADVLRHPERFAEKIRQARKAVENHTWEKRMERILSAIT